MAPSAGISPASPTFEASRSMIKLRGRWGFTMYDLRFTSGWNECGRSSFVNRKSQIKRRGSLRPRTRVSGRRLVEPEVVATSPGRIKSPVPVYCGFDSESGALIRAFTGLSPIPTECIGLYPLRAGEFTIYDSRFTKQQPMARARKS
jgi:hypothetical protein